VIDISVESFEKYELIVVPSLYVASDERLEKLNEYVRNGGHVVYTFKSGFSNENSQVRTDIQPGIISEVCGVQYSQFVEPEDVTLRDDPFDVGKDHNIVHTWMELLQPTTAEVLAWYDHTHWGEYAAITTNQYGKGRATYIGCIPSPSVIKKVLKRTLKEAGVWDVDQTLQFPLIVKSGANDLGRTVRYYFNYSEDSQTFVYAHSNGQELLENRPVVSGQQVKLDRWGVAIIEEQ
jgi:beta-galactosidase